MLKSYKHYKNIPNQLKQQLVGLGKYTSSGSIRPLARGVDAWGTCIRITMLVKADRIVSWGIIVDYIYDNPRYSIQLYTRVSERQKGYGQTVYGHLSKYIPKVRGKVFDVCVFPDNIDFWKKVGKVRKNARCDDY